MGNSSADQNKDPQTKRLSTAQGGNDEPVPSGFASTLADENAVDGNDWWPESSDGQCSENAALFAASQPAPLSIV